RQLGRSTPIGRFWARAGIPLDDIPCSVGAAARSVLYGELHFFFSRSANTFGSVGGPSLASAKLFPLVSTSANGKVSAAAATFITWICSIRPFLRLSTNSGVASKSAKHALRRQKKEEVLLIAGSSSMRRRTTVPLLKALVGRVTRNNFLGSHSGSIRA